MFERNNGASDDTSSVPATAFFAETAERVKKGLARDPNATARWLGDLSALETALAAYVKNQDKELLGLALGVLERINEDGDFEGLDNETLGALILLDLRAAQLVGEGTRLNATTGKRAIDAANRRWDGKLNYFKMSATDATRSIDVRANAKLGEAYYFGWRALDNQPLREKAGEILGHVSTAFDANAALYTTDDQQIYQPHKIWELGTVAAAMQFFLTASETTGRGTYMPRALILAEKALATFQEQDMPWGQIDFATALLRLEQFSGQTKIGERARELLMDATRALPPGHSKTALALEAAEHFPLHIVIVGDVENDANAKAMWFAAMEVYAPLRAIEALHPLQHATRIAQLGYDVTDASARAYICTGEVCLPAVKSVEAFREAMARTRRN